MPWGGTYSVLADLALPSNEFTLDDSSLGVLGGNCYLDGRTTDDITDRVQEIRISRGRHDQFQDFQAGIMTLVLTNNDRELDPRNTQSRYYDPLTDTSGVTIRRKVTVYYGNTAIFTGRITDIDISYDPTSSPITRSTVTIDVADDFVLLANAYLDEYFPTSQLSGARVSAILDLPEIGFSGTTDIESGTITCLDDPISFGTRALDALQAVAATERGVLVVKGDGTLYFGSRVTGSPTIDHYFSDDGVGSEYNQLSIVYGQENLYNRVICTPIDSVNPGVADNATSQSTYGIAALSVNNLLCSDSDAQDLADYLLTLYGLPSYRFDGLEVQFAGASVPPAEQQQIIDLDIGANIRVLKTYAIGSPSTLFQNVTIEHIDHVITAQSHTVSYKLAPASFETYSKTASGAGTSGGTAVGLHIADRTAVGSGSATAGDTASGLHIAPRNATGDGSGSSAADGLRSVLRTADGSATSSGTSDWQKVSLIRLDDATNGLLDTNVLGEYNILFKTASGSGSATAGDTASGVHISPREASGSGLGSETATARNATENRAATGSGTGDSTSTGIKSLVVILDSATMGLLDTNTLDN